MAGTLTRRRALRPYSRAELAARAGRVALALFDVDGVLTDGRIYLGAAGEEMKAFNVADGYGIRMLIEAGIEVGILSGRSAGCVERRAAELGIRHVVQGAGHKLPAFQRLLDELRLSASQIAYMGDDVPDLPVLQACGLALTVPDAPIAVRRAAHHTVARRGGEGAVREACELLLRLRRRAAAADHEE